MAFKRDDIEQYPYIAYTDDSNGLPVLEIHVVDVEGGNALDRTWREIDSATLGVVVFESDGANARAIVVATAIGDDAYIVAVNDFMNDFSIYTTDNPNGYPMIELG